MALRVIAGRPVASDEERPLYHPLRNASERASDDYYNRRSIDTSVTCGAWCFGALIAFFIIGVVAHYTKAALDIVFAALGIGV